MLDPTLLRTNINKIAKKLNTRGYSLDINKFQELEKQRYTLQINTNNLKARHNAKSKEVAKLKVIGKDIYKILKEMKEVAKHVKNMEIKLKEVTNNITKMMLDMPNLPAKGVQNGRDESDNIEIRRWNKPRQFNFIIKDHVEIGKQLGSMDFESAVKLTGNRFVVMHDNIARLHRALAQFMLDIHVDRHYYQEIYVPYLVNKDSLFATGQLPKLSEDLFHIEGNFPFYLIPTAEVMLTNLIRNEIISIDNLPLRFVAHTPCFRSEAGSYGKDTRGIIRQHQFDKVELVQIVTPENALLALEELTEHAEYILRALKLPYRVIQLCTADMGFSACKTYDLEVWIPSQNTYREVSSCSWCSDFQARRMKGRFKRDNNKKPSFLHTLNGSGLAVGRTLAAVIENYQQSDGSIEVPKVLHQYMNGLKTIKIK